MIISECLEKFVNDNFTEFSQLDNSEVIQYPFADVELDELAKMWLLNNYRFDYKGICVYFVAESKEIWVENMES